MEYLVGPVPPSELEQMQSDTVYLGGNPNFEESTGTYRRPLGTGIVPTKGENDEAHIVRALQSGLNLLNGQKNQSPLPGAPKTPMLKEDGIVGPKTSQAMKKALMKNETPKVAEAMALGKAKETVKKAKTNGAENLAEELGATFSPLIGNAKLPKDGFQPEGLALQDTLNDLGANLKDDGIVGPKTKAAFEQIAKTKDADEIVYRFAHNLGFDF